jgi:hypothetical protein
LEIWIESERNRSVTNYFGALEFMRTHTYLPKLSNVIILFFTNHLYPPRTITDEYLRSVLHVLIPILTLLKLFLSKSPSNCYQIAIKSRQGVTCVVRKTIENYEWTISLIISFWLLMYKWWSKVKNKINLTSIFIFFWFQIKMLHWCYTNVTLI